MITSEKPGPWGVGAHPANLCPEQPSLQVTECSEYSGELAWELAWEGAISPLGGSAALPR